MYRQDFFSNAFAQPASAYHISRELARLYPRKAMVEGSQYNFELEDYARAGLCHLVRDTELHAQYDVGFVQRRQRLDETIVQGWFNVLWRGQLLDVVFVTIGDNTRLHWILADERSIAEDFFRAVCEFAVEPRGELLVFQEGSWEKDKDLYQAIKTAAFDDLILPPALRRELETDVADFFNARETYERYRIAWKRGVLFIGAPGNGKTHAIKALINHTAKPCLYVKSFKARFQSDHATMRKVFQQARYTAPGLLVFEDLDSLVTNGNRSFFLNELDGFAENTGLVVIGSTNHPERLDASILDRPSRFDRKFYFELPAYTERARYFAKWSAGLEANMRLCESTIHQAATETENFSFAYLKEATLSALMQWINGGVLDTRTGAMNRILLERINTLRTQMTAPPTKTESPASDDPEADDFECVI